MQVHYLNFDESRLCLLFPKEHRFAGGCYCRFFPKQELDETWQKNKESYMEQITEQYGNSLVPELSGRILKNVDKLEKASDTEDLILDCYPAAWFNCNSNSEESRNFSLATFSIDNFAYFVIVDFGKNEDADSLIREQILKGDVWKKPL